MITNASGPKATRVLLLGPLPPPYGGPEVMTQTLLQGLRSSSRIVVKHLDMQVSRSLADKGGRRQLVKSWLGLIQAIRLFGALITFRPDVVYLPLTNSPSFLGFLRDCMFMAPALLARRKVIVRLHGGYYFYVRCKGLKRRIVALFLSRLSLVMVQGERLRAEFDGFVSPDRVVVIPNGIDGTPFAEARANPSRGTNGRKRVLFVGLLCDEKGVGDIVRAMPLVPNADFVFLGEWESDNFAESTRAFLDARDLNQRAIFRGVVSGSAKYQEFVNSDVFVFPSYFVYEGHAVSSVEALAARLPIVCTDHGALGESVKPGWNGFFVPPHDPTAIADKLRCLLEDDSLRATMAECSGRLYTERFTREKFVAAWVDAVCACPEASGRPQ